jgi:KDO2-lipid IV(A) lauroyltransferase
MANLTVLFVSLMLRLFSLVPPRMADRVARPIAFLLKYLVPRKRRVTRRNLALVYPNLSDAERSQMADLTRFHYVKNLFEAGYTWHWSTERLDAVFEPMQGTEHLDQAIASGQGVIVAVLHFGSWELVNFHMRPYRAAVLYRAGKHPELEAMLAKKRTHQDVRLIPANRSGMKQIYAQLMSGGNVGILPDQEPHNGKGHFVPFMGIPALTAVLIPRLIQKTGARLLYAVCERQPKGRYQVHLRAADDAVYATDMETALTAMNRDIEKCIKIDPAQYLWAYKRFRTRPPGDPPLY